MKIEIKHRITAEVIFTFEANAGLSKWRALGTAVLAAVASNINLRAADLSGADLRGAELCGANLRGVYLSGAELSGVDLSGADLRGVDLSGADLCGANLRGVYLRGADLSGADLRAANLSGADLSGADLRGVDLSGADLRGADLSGAELSGAPVIPDIHAKVYAAATARPKLFDMSTFATGSGHTCGTTQCRAGWVLAVSGREGLDLEAKIGTPAAAMAIYMASDPDRWKTERLPDFYNQDNAAVLADMARMAGVLQ